MEFKVNTFVNICLALLTAASNKPPKCGVYGGIYEIHFTEQKSCIFSSRQNRVNILKCMEARLRLEPLS